ncbi:hypothetical protein [Streptomyces yerevanensis]|uniref:hypothetical protein n=1 Tax=Streptomyces yerevanensis TaxID=66378 RepID=UPI0007C52C1E|nr:hypothetical protein [Streptomyces yerevanensis]
MTDNMAGLPAKQPERESTVGPDTTIGSGKTVDTGKTIGGSTGRLMSHDESDKWTLRLQHAVSGFVDGPRESLEEADQVLDEVTARFTDAVTQRRRTLRTSWQTTGDEKADTEQLRLALRDYRELAERLLRI